MATQVEVTSSLTSLSSLREIPGEASLQHAFKTPQHPSPLSAKILEEGAKFGSFARPVTMPPAASKPRLTPKPFSREKSLEAFAVVKPPVPALRPSPTAPRPSLFAKTFEEAADAKQLVGSVPPLVDQNPVGNKSSSELVANVPICSASPTNTIILIETRNADKNGVRLTAEKSHSPLQTPEGPFLFSKSEVSHRKPEGLGLQRQSSLCSESWPTSWNPCRPPERRDAFSAAPNEEKAKTDEKQQGVGVVASEVQGRPKQRPVSAIFLQSLKDQKQPGSDISEEKPAPEKSWVRKPRPLSVDLTAKFENREHSVQRKPCQSEGKERTFAAPSPEADGSKPSEMGATGEGEGLRRVGSSEPRLESVALAADHPGVKSKGGTQTQKPSAGDVAPLSWSAPKDQGQFSTKDQKYLWDLRLRIQEEEHEREMDRPAASVKSRELSSSKGGLSFKEDPLLNQMETDSVRESAENVSDAESKHLREGSVRKTPPSLNVLSNDATPVNAEPVSENLGKESRIINIQQRIKELTLEQADAKPVGPRRSFRSRPLSADLTKVFSSPVATSETKPERQSEANVQPSSRAQDLQENGTAVPGAPRKPQQPVKAPHSDIVLERCGSFAKQRANGLLQSETSTSGVDLDTQTHPKSSVESGRIKTVRATMFEHNVQRRHVAADRFEAESVLQQGNEPVGERLRRGESWVEKAAETKASKPVPSRQAETLVDAERNRSAKPLKEEKAPEGPAWEKLSPKEKCEKISSKPLEDSLVSQRIEPRYEILQTVGERVQSEAVVAVPEDKAVTLRSRRSLKEKKVGGRTLDASGPCGLHDSKEDGFAPSVRGAAETATKAAAPSQHGFCGPAAESEGNQTEQCFASVKALGLPGRSKAFGATEDKVFRWSSEMEKEQRGVLFADNLEGSKRLKRLSGSSRTDTSKARINASDSLTPGSPGEYGSQPSVHGSSQWPKPSQEPPLANVDPLRTYKQEESKVFALRTRLAPFGAQAETCPVNGGTEGHQPKQPEAEERLGKSGQGASATKVSERWRRKTLPHGAGRFEEAAALSREGIKALSRRDSLQLCDGSVAKRSPESDRGEEPTGESTFSPSSLRNLPSSMEPKATYFAVTCQVPKEEKTPSGTAFDPLKSKGVPLLAEQASISPTASTSRKSYLLGNSFPDAQESLERPLGKNWSEGAGKGASGLAKKEALKYPPSEMKGENWRSLERQAEEAKGKVMAVGSPLTNKARFCLKDLERDGEHLVPKKPSDQSHSVAKEKSSSGSYRLRVLDIDALMAEYGGDSKKTVIGREEGAGGVPEGGGWLSWEKVSKRNFASRVSGEGSPGVAKALESPPGALWHGFSAAEFRRSEKETLELSGSHLSPLKAGDMKFSPPYCGKSAAESPKRLFPDPVSSSKKTFIVDEDNGEKLVLGHQRAKYANFNAQNSGQVCTDLDAEAGFVPCPPQVPSGGVWGKGTPSRHQGALHAEDGLSAGVNTSGLNKRKASVKESSADHGSSAVRSGAEWNSAASMLASTPPDLRRSFSEKAHQSRARDSFPFGSGTREKQDQSKARQSFPPDSADVRLNKRGAAEQSCPLREGIKQNLEKAWSKQDPESSGVRSSPYLPIQRRSHSFYRDRRTGYPAEDQLKQCFGKPAAEAKDTDTLVQEADSQYGTWSDQRHSGDSFALESPSSDSHVATARKQPSSSRLSSFSSQTDPASTTDQLDSSREQRSTSLDRSSTDVDSADGTEVPVPASASPDFSFLDQTAVLDSSALKTRVQLSKRRRQHRAPISHTLRRSTGADAEQRLPASIEADSAWMFRDSTEKSTKREDSEKDERACPAERSPASQPQRLPVFPGMDHSVLKAQLRKRHEPDGAGDGSPAQSSKSPKSSFQTGVAGSRMLPIGTDKEERSEEPSPQWLRDLKSKKRQSQYENQV